MNILDQTSSVLKIQSQVIFCFLNQPCHNLIIIQTGKPVFAKTKIILNPFKFESVISRVVSKSLMLDSIYNNLPNFTCFWGTHITSNLVIIKLNMIICSSQLFHLSDEPWFQGSVTYTSGGKAMYQSQFIALTLFLRGISSRSLGGDKNDN